MNELKEVLLSLYESNDNRLTPHMVVDAARDEESPLHHHFEWDNAQAAEMHRLNQARALIRTVRINFISDSGETAKVPAFISVALPGGNSYVPTEVIQEDPFMSAMVKRQAEREWRQLLARYKHIDEFLTVVAEDLKAL